MKKALTLCLLLIFELVSLAQPIFNEERFSANNGIRSVVQGTFQDNQGYLWFATWSGLEKYDGYSFKSYKSHVGDGSTLTNNRIISVQEGWNKNLWCCTYDNRVFLFDVHNEFFIDALLPIEQMMKRKNVVQTIYTLPKGITWIVCSGGFNYRVEEKRLKEKGSIKYYGTFDGSLRGDHVYSVFQDREGDEWILTDKGPSICGRKQIDCDSPFQYYQEKGQSIWLATANGFLVRYDKKHQQVVPISIPYSIHRVISLNMLRDGTLVMGTDMGLIMYSTVSGKFEKSDSSVDNSAAFAGEDHWGNIWFVDNRKGINRYDRLRKTITHYFTLDEYLPETEQTGGFFFHEDKNGNIIVWPKYGVLGYYDAEKDKLIPVIANGSYIDMKTFFFDRQGNLWHSDQHNLSKLTLFNRNFLLKNDAFEVRSLFIDRQKRIWIASKDGYIRIEKENKNLIGYLNREGQISSNKVSFGSNVYSMMQEDDGTIWMGMRNDGLIILKPNSLKENSYKIITYKNIKTDPYSLSDNSLFSILKDSKKRIWIGTYGGGLNLVQNSTDLYHLRFINKNNQLVTYPKEFYSKIRFLFEHQNVIFVCTTDGLLTYSARIDNISGIKFFRNERSPYRADGLSNNNVMRIFKDRHENLYAVEYGGGFSRILSKNYLSDHLIFKSYSEKEGLLSDLALSMVEDKNGYLWIFMERGISKFNPREEAFVNFKNDFFMRDFSISECMPVVDSHGDIWIGTDMGYLSFSPICLTKRHYIPYIVFTEVKSQNKIFKSSRYDNNKLEIKPDERSFSIQFAALDYANSVGINYAYRLKGGEDDWHYIGTSREANYINIPHGEYEFQVKSTNGDGVWYNNIRTLKIIVEPTFWETPWAWIIYIFLLFIIVSVIAYFMFYIYRLRHQVDIEQRLSEVKLRFFTDISHELRTPLSLICSPIDEVLDSEQLSDQAKSYLSVAKNNADRMLRLINQILDFRKIQSNKMKILVEEIEIVSFLSKIIENFRSIAEERHLQYKYEPQIGGQMIWADRDKLEKIFYNLISNAFKYTPEGKGIIVTVNKDGENLSVRVIDEGIGINSMKFAKLFQRFETLANQNIMQPSSGIGLSLVKEFIELHHAKIDVKSAVGKGSEFMVTFLLGKEHFVNDDHVEFILNDSGESVDSLVENIENKEEKETEKLSILIVEDNKELSFFLKSVLGHSYSVIEAADGSQGLKAAIGNMPDIIITDIMMPVMDGIEMIKCIKADKNICHIPIIILTAKASLDDRIAGLKTGIDDYLTKPFSATYLKTRVATLLQQRKQLQESYIQLLSGYKEESLNNINLQLSKPCINSFDDEFVKKVMEFIESNVDEPNLTIDEFAEYLNMSRTVFYRKLKAMTGLSPIEFIMKMRINRAIQLIETGKYTFSQIAYMSGFADPKYFSKCFKRFKGATPSEYKETLGEIVD